MKCEKETLAAGVPPPDATGKPHSALKYLLVGGIGTFPQTQAINAIGAASNLRLQGHALLLFKN